MSGNELAHQGFSCAMVLTKFQIYIYIYIHPPHNDHFSLLSWDICDRCTAPVGDPPMDPMQFGFQCLVGAHILT